MTKYLKEQIEVPTSSVEEYFPNVIRPAPEIMQVAKSVNTELNVLWSQLCQWVLGNFVYDTDEVTIRRWEKMFGLEANETLPLEDRQFAILSHGISNRPYTYRKLELILDSLCGKGNYLISLNHSQYSIEVFIDLGVKFQQDVVRNTLFKTLPANLTLAVTLRYNRHIDLRRYTHGRMRALNLTHFNLKEDVLPNA